MLTSGSLNQHRAWDNAPRIDQAGLGAYRPAVPLRLADRVGGECFSRSSTRTPPQNHLSVSFYESDEVFRWTQFLAAWAECPTIASAQV